LFSQLFSFYFEGLTSGLTEDNHNAHAFFF